MAYAWAHPYWEDKETEKKEVKKMEDNYDEGKKIVQGIAKYSSNLKKKVSNLDNKMPSEKVEEVEEYVEAKPMSAYAQQPLAPYAAVTPYDWYKSSGTCELTDYAYGQCVEWKQHPTYFNQKTKKRSPNYLKSNYTHKQYQREVARVNQHTGMAYIDRVYNTGYDYKPSYGRASSLAPKDLYNGSTVLPVEVTDSYGKKSIGQKVVSDNYDDTKDVTIFEATTGRSNTLRLKDSQTVTDVKEIDLNYDRNVDKQLVTVCDGAT